MTRASGRARIRLPVGPFIESLLAGDPDGAAALAARALQLLGTRAGVFSDLLQPAQYEIGELWYAGRLGVAEEHRASAVVERVALSLPPTPGPSPVPSGSRILLAAVGPEQHVLGLRLLGLALEDDGWATTFLGAQVPPQKLLNSLQEGRFDLAALSAGHVPDPQPLRRTVEAVRAMGVRVLVGGPAFNRSPDLWRRVGADAHGSDARISLVLARRLLAT